MKNKDKQYKVQVIHTDTGEVVKEFSPTSLRQCERVEMGVSINLNHREYDTKIVEV